MIELMVVVVLMGLAASMVALRLDGFTEHGRLRRAVHQIGAVHTQARIEAITSGQPRRVAYAAGESHCTLERPGVTASGWNWVAGANMLLGPGVTMDRLVYLSMENKESTEPRTFVRIRSDGRSSSYVVLFRSGSRYAAAMIDGVTGRLAYRFDLSPQERQDLAILWLDPL